jgi:copper(I)-binding protein
MSRSGSFLSPPPKSAGAQAGALPFLCEKVTHVSQTALPEKPRERSQPMKNSRVQNRMILISIAALMTIGAAASAQQSSDMNGMAGMTRAHEEVPADAGAAKAGDLDLSGGYVKAMLPGQPVGGGYLTIRNAGSSGDTLVSVSSTAAAAVELHEMTMKDGIMRMREVKGGIPIAAGATVSLSPDTLHMMFKQVKAPFKQGGTVAVTLQFEKAGKVDMTLPIVSARGK